MEFLEGRLVAGFSIGRPKIEGNASLIKYFAKTRIAGTRRLGNLHTLYIVGKHERRRGAFVPDRLQLANSTFQLSYPIKIVQRGLYRMCDHFSASRELQRFSAQPTAVVLHLRAPRFPVNEAGRIRSAGSRRKRSERGRYRRVFVRRGAAVPSTKRGTVVGRKNGVLFARAGEFYQRRDYFRALKRRRGKIVCRFRVSYPTASNAMSFFPRGASCFGRCSFSYLKNRAVLTFSSLPRACSMQVKVL